MELVFMMKRASCDINGVMSNTSRLPTTTDSLQTSAAVASSSTSAFPLPRVTTTKTNDPMIIMVLTRRTARHVRQAIRETWGRSAANLYFVMGQACPVPPRYRPPAVDLRPQDCRVAPQPLHSSAYFNDTEAHLEHIRHEDEILRQEQKEHHDLLMMDTVDQYSTLPQKLKYAYSFVYHHVPHAQWVLKVDDDFFVRTDDTREFLLSFDSSRAILVGNMQDNCFAKRDGKWKEVPQFPPGILYPLFPKGSSGHAVTRPIMKFIVEHQQALFNYQGEDVSMGIWLNTTMAPNVTFHHTRHMVSSGKCSDPKAFVVGHNISADLMRSCQSESSGTAAALMPQSAKLTTEQAKPSQTSTAGTTTPRAKKTEEAKPSNRTAP